MNEQPGRWSITNTSSSKATTHKLLLGFICIVASFFLPFNLPMSTLLVLSLWGCWAIQLITLGTMSGKLLTPYALMLTLCCVSLSLSAQPKTT